MFQEEGEKPSVSIEEKIEEINRRIERQNWNPIKFETPKEEKKDEQN